MLWPAASAAAHGRLQPGAGIGPMPVSGARGNTQDVGGLIAGQTSEVAQLDEASLDGILDRQQLQRLVQSQQFVAGLRRGHIREFLARPAPAVLFSLLAPRLVDED